MNMKAISPMLATILLIAFTVAVGGILSVWMSSFTRTTSSSVENTSTDVTKCAGTYIDITSITTTGMVITNRGSQNINNIQCFMSNGTNITAIATASLAPGASNAAAITRGTTNTRIDCSGLCLTVGVTGYCRSGDNCWV